MAVGSPRAASGPQDELDGEEFLHAWIDRFQPDMVLSGHLQNSPFYVDSSWIDRIGRAWVFNRGSKLLSPVQLKQTSDLFRATVAHGAAPQRPFAMTRQLRNPDI